MDFDGLKIVVDCANGAAYQAPRRTVLWELGAEIVPIGVAPNGFNINDAAAPPHQAWCRQGDRGRADLGICLDGDADRVHIIDNRARSSTATRSWRCRELGTGGAPARRRLVATVMSNLGLERHLDEHRPDASAPRSATAMS